MKLSLVSGDPWTVSWLDGKTFKSYCIPAFDKEAHC